MNELDHLLTEASPRTTREVPEVADAVRSMVGATGATARRSHKLPLRRSAIAAMIAGVAIGGAGIAVAAPAFEWFDGATPERELRTTSAQGSSCEHAFRVVPDGVANSDPSVVAARATLADLDFGSLDLRSVETSLEQRRLLDASLTPDQREAEILNHAVSEAVFADLKERGLSSEVLTLEGGTDCVPGSR